MPPVFSVQLSWLDQHLGFGCWLTWEEFSGFHYRRGREYCLWSLFHPHLEQDRTLGNFQIIWPFNMTWQPQFLFFRLAVVIAIPNCLQSRKNYRLVTISSLVLYSGFFGTICDLMSYNLHTNLDAPPQCAHQLIHAEQFWCLHLL